MDWFFQEALWKADRRTDWWLDMISGWKTFRSSESNPESSWEKLGSEREPPVCREREREREMEGEMKAEWNSRNFAFFVFIVSQFCIFKLKQLFVHSTPQSRARTWSSKLDTLWKYTRTNTRWGKKKSYDQCALSIKRTHQWRLHGTAVVTCWCHQEKSTFISSPSQN